MLNVRVSRFSFSIIIFFLLLTFWKATSITRPSLDLAPWLESEDWTERNDQIPADDDALRSERSRPGPRPPNQLSVLGPVPPAPSQARMREEMEKVYRKLNSYFSPPSAWPDCHVPQTYYLPNVNLVSSTHISQ